VNGPRLFDRVVEFGSRDVDGEVVSTGQLLNDEGYDVVIGRSSDEEVRAVIEEGLPVIGGSGHDAGSLDIASTCEGDCELVMIGTAELVNVDRELG